MTDFLYELLLALLSNLVWAGLIFAYFYVKDRKQREYEKGCLIAYLLFLESQRKNLQNFMGPYIFLLEKKVDQSEILTRTLNNIHRTVGEILQQTQITLGITAQHHPATHQQLMELYQKVLTFQNKVSSSLVQVDLIVGNPQELFETEKHEQEQEAYKAFLELYPEKVLKSYETLEDSLKQQLPSDYKERLQEKLEMGGNF